MLVALVIAEALEAATARSRIPTNIHGSTPIIAQQAAMTHIGPSIRESDSCASPACALRGAPAKTAPRSLTNVPTAIAPTSANAGATNATQLHPVAGPIAVRKRPM